MTVTDMTDAQDNAQSKSEAQRRLRRKNLALLAVLVGWAVIFYFVAIFRMSGA